jgi:hypothetical protein
MPVSFATLKSSPPPCDTVAAFGPPFETLREREEGRAVRNGAAYAVQENSIL